MGFGMRLPVGGAMGKVGAVPREADADETAGEDASTGVDDDDDAPDASASGAVGGGGSGSTSASLGRWLATSSTFGTVGVGAGRTMAMVARYAHLSPDRVIALGDMLSVRMGVGA